MTFEHFFHHVCLQFFKWNNLKFYIRTLSVTAQSNIFICYLLKPAEKQDITNKLMYFIIIIIITIIAHGKAKSINSIVGH